MEGYASSPARLPPSHAPAGRVMKLSTAPGQEHKARFVQQYIASALASSTREHDVTGRARASPGVVVR